jgi:alpha-1,6-mannosyltransferase
VRHEVRAVLGLFNAFCLLSFRNGVLRTFGRNAANWYTIFQAGQFHMMYYASRTLPNFFAFGLSRFNIRSINERDAKRK